MLYHLINLLHRAFLAVPTALGSTWLGLFFPLWGFIIAQVVILFADGWAKMKTHWRQNVIRGFAVAGAAWASLFLWCVFTTTYEDHVTLNAHIGELSKSVGRAEAHEDAAVRTVRQDLGDQLAGLRQSCAELTGAKKELDKRVGAQQDSINNCQTEAIKRLSPEPQKITILTLDDKDQGKNDRDTSFLLVTNRDIPITKIDGLCDVYLKTINVDVVGSGFFTGGAEIIGKPPAVFRYGQTPAPMPFTISIQSPAWTPVSPIRMRITYSSYKTASCTFVVR